MPEKTPNPFTPVTAVRETPFSETIIPAKGGARHYVAAAATALLMATILGWLLYRERASLAAIDLSHAWPRLASGQVLILATLLLAALVWASIMRVLGSRGSMRTHIHIYSSTFLARYVPGTVWYVVGRGALYRSEGDSARLVAVGSAVEMLVSTLAGATLAIGFGLRGTAEAPAATLPLLAISIGIGLAALHPRVLAWLTARLRLPPIPPLRVQSLAGWLLADGVNWLLGGFVVWLIASEIGGAPRSTLVFTIFAWTLVGVVSTAVYFLPSNFGITEVGLSLLLSSIMPSSLAVVVAVLTRVLITVFSIVACGLIVAVTSLWPRSVAPKSAQE